MKKLALLLPGFLDSRNYAHLVDLGNKLGSLEYTVVRLNPTGTWEDSENISKYSMSRYLADVDVEIKKHRDASEILLAGHSLGGSIALLYASRHSNIATAIGIMSPATYIRDENINKINKWKAAGYRVSVRDIPGVTEKTISFKLPFSFIEDSKQYDVSKGISNFKGNLLLIAGELDDVVVPQQLKDIYKEANQPKTLEIIKGIGHDYRHNKDEIEIVNNTIIELINKSRASK